MSAHLFTVAVGAAVRYDAGDALAKQRLLADVNALRAHGGADCPELGLMGILNALNVSFPNGELIVLTDASAKDSHQTDAVIQEAQTLEVRVHFVYSHKSGCGLGYPAYDRVARATGGFTVFGLTNLDTLSNAIQSARVAFRGVDGHSASSLLSAGECRAISVPLFTEKLRIAINPGASSVVASLRAPNGSYVIEKGVVPSLLINTFKSSVSGRWIVCVHSGSVGIKHSQDVRFDINAEFLAQDEISGLYFANSTPPFTHSEAIAILSSTRLANLSDSLLHTLRVSSINGSKLRDVPLLQCNNFLEGRFSLPSAQYRLSFLGFDSNNNSFSLELGTYSEGPEPGESVTYVSICCII